MKEYLVEVVEVFDGDDEDAILPMEDMWFFACQAEDPEHAVEQALDHSPGHMVTFGVYEKVK